MLLSVMGLYQYDNTIFDVMELPEDLDATTLKAEILAECAELEVILPDPDVFKEVLNYWSKAHLSNWQHLMDVLEMEYNPIWNKDGTYTETRNLASSANSTGQVSAFNSTTFQNADHTEATGTDTGTITRRETGNIGVTSTQSMIREEVEIRKDFNIYQIIVEDFKSRFCLMVY